MNNNIFTIIVGDDYKATKTFYSFACYYQQILLTL